MPPKPVEASPRPNGRSCAVNTPCGGAARIECLEPLSLDHSTLSLVPSAATSADRPRDSPPLHLLQRAAGTTTSQRPTGTASRATPWECPETPRQARYLSGQARSSASSTLDCDPHPKSILEALCTSALCHCDFCCLFLGFRGWMEEGRIAFGEHSPYAQGLDG